MTKFAPSRTDGRSDRAIILDLARAAEPGSVITYDAISVALRSGTDRAITREVIGAAARAASRRLLRETQRCLAVIPKVGYRVSVGSDHHGLAVQRYHRADKQLLLGVDVLQQVRRDEMTPNQQMQHDGMLIVMSSLVAMTESTRRRQDKIEAAIAKIAGKVGVVIED